MKMENLSLYRKYRPSNFENLVGQKQVKTTLINAVKNNQAAHAYIFSGPRGTGKTSTARLMAKALTCTNLKDGFEPCDACDFCNDISIGRLIDLVEIDAASNRGIEEIRDLKQKIVFAPTRAKYKIYIIDEAHMLTTPAFNALLKTLEEPPSHAYFILATTELHKIPETIISRCQSFDFKRLSQQDIVDRLRFISDKEKIKIDTDSLELIARYVNGGMRDAIGLLEQLSVSDKIDIALVQDTLGLTGNKFLEDFYKVIIEKDTQKAFGLIEKLHVQGSDIKQFIHDFIGFLRTKLHFAVSTNNMRAISALVDMIDVFNDSLKIFGLNIPQLPLEVAVIKLCNNVQVVSEKVVSNPEPVAVKTVAQKTNSVETPAVNSVPKTTTNIKPPSAEIIKNVKPVGDFSIDALKNNWIQVLDYIKKPTVHRSLKNGEPVKLDGNKLLIKFVSQFHCDMVMTGESRQYVEESIKEIFNKDVLIESIVDTTDAPSIEVDKTPVKESTAEPSIDDALNIFGGTVV